MYCRKLSSTRKSCVKFTQVFLSPMARHTVVSSIAVRSSPPSYPSSETQGQSVGSGEKARRKFFSSGEGAPGYRLSPDHFQKFKRMPAPDWAQKNLCIIVPNQRTASPEFFSCVRTRLLLSRHTCLVRSPRLCVQFAREICPFCFPKQKRRSYR